MWWYEIQKNRDCTQKGKNSQKELIKSTPIFFVSKFKEPFLDFPENLNLKKGLYYIIVE
jgi:hypothetical protein